MSTSNVFHHGNALLSQTLHNLTQRTSIETQKNTETFFRCDDLMHRNALLKPCVALNQIERKANENNDETNNNTHITVTCKAHAARSNSREARRLCS